MYDIWTNVLDVQTTYWQKIYSVVDSRRNPAHHALKPLKLAEESMK